MRGGRGGMGGGMGDNMDNMWGPPPPEDGGFGGENMWGPPPPEDGGFGGDTNQQGPPPSEGEQFQEAEEPMKRQFQGEETSVSAKKQFRSINNNTMQAKLEKTPEDFDASFRDNCNDEAPRTVVKLSPSEFAILKVKTLQLHVLKKKYEVIQSRNQSGNFSGCQTNWGRLV